MPLFAVHCRDGPDGAVRRKQALEEHLRYIEEVLDKIRIAGPLHDLNGATVGSLLIIEAEELSDAEALVAADPYAKAGVWCDVRVTLFRGVAGDWAGGTSWPSRLAARE